MTRTTHPRVALTPGEPAGIGPDLVLSLPAHYRESLIVIADPQVLRERAAMLGIEVDIVTTASGNHDELLVHEVPTAAPVSSGVLDTTNAEYVLETLRSAARGCLQGTHAGLVTGPVNKAVINEAGIPFSGHTEFLAELAEIPMPVMMLAAPSLRVALVTTHLPLREVSDAITPERLRETLEIVHKSLVERFGIAKPTMLVCGLNPHAGESGHFGHEETDTIEPVLAALREQGMNVVGPLPADTAFTPDKLAGADAVVAMYHDQGLPVLKTIGFGEAVNITLGLPFVRTSVDHGTALNLAGTGAARNSSLIAAIDCALELVGPGDGPRQFRQ